MLTTILRYAKAVVGGLAAGIATLTPLASAGPLTLTDWLGVLAAVLGGAGLVAFVPNKTTTPPPSTGSAVSSVPPPAA
jgi:hypothetical protein